MNTYKVQLKNKYNKTVLSQSLLAKDEELAEFVAKQVLKAARNKEVKFIHLSKE